mmetsp:Transcript_7327/g.7187  ORF Transcript_7327/g.7187 Transcript_7327/m.7187 type:complete len:107 (+) Transcript_7327:231-551(+)
MLQKVTPSGTSSSVVQVLVPVVAAACMNISTEYRNPTTQQRLTLWKQQQQIQQQHQLLQLQLLRLQLVQPVTQQQQQQTQQCCRLFIQRIISILVGFIVNIIIIII